MANFYRFITRRLPGPATLCLIFASAGAAGKQQLLDLHPPTPPTCKACRPIVPGLPFDPPTKGVIVTLTGDIIAFSDYYVVDLSKKKICHFDGRRYQDTNDLIKNRICAELKYDDFRSIVAEANFVWEQSTHPCNRSRAYSTAPTKLQIFDHERSYTSIVVSHGPLPFGAERREPEEGLVDVILAVAPR